MTAVVTIAVLALLAGEHGDWRQALEHVGRVLYIDPEFVLAHYLAARLNREVGDGEAAARSLRAAGRVLDGLPEDAAVPFSDGLSVAQLRGLLGGERPWVLAVA